MPVFGIRSIILVLLSDDPAEGILSYPFLNQIAALPLSKASKKSL